MNAIDIFIVTLYYHFCKMQMRGRKIIPWFQTTFVISLIITISFFLILFLGFQGSIKKLKLPEWLFIIIFCFIGGFVFFIIKRFFFDSGRHLFLSEKYINEYSTKRRSIFKIIVISICFLVPLLLGFIFWLNAE